MDAKFIAFNVLISGGFAATVAYLVVKLAFKQAVEDAIEKTITRMYDRIDGIYNAITDLKDNVQENYVTCKYCTMQHENDAAMHKSINAKLDILISNK